MITGVPFEHFLFQTKVGYTMLYTSMEEEAMSFNIGSKQVEPKTTGLLVRRNSL